MEIFIGGLPAVVVILALVEWFKKINVPTVALPYVSMFIGLLFGIGYQWSLAPLITFTDWFNAVFFGIAYGLIASGLYDVAKSVVKKIE